MRGLYPLRFQPVYKDYIWGGDKIIKRYGRATAGLARYAESWEVSDRPEGMSVVADGSLAGRSLRDLVTEFGSKLTGRELVQDRFPLLIKIIDAHETLSVQVHPDDAAAAQFGGEPKSEMWYVLQADPGAFIYHGFKKPVDRAAFEKALAANGVEGLLKKIPVKAGDAIYVPGGCVHAIGAGCLLLEIQQSSDTTYRIYDWNRPGPDGKPRKLHIDEALKVIRWDQTQTVGPEHSPYFRFATSAVKGPVTEKLDGRSFHVLFVESGRMHVDGVEVSAGESLLVPAGLASYTVDGDARVCMISIP